MKEKQTRGTEYFQFENVSSDIKKSAKKLRVKLQAPMVAANGKTPISNEGNQDFFALKRNRG